MKKLVEVQEVKGEGLSKFLGEKILLMCANYFYTGKLAGINDTCVLLEEAKIVYETGSWVDPIFKDAQALPGPWYIQLSAIESFGPGK